jgi:hypothetical protein
MIEENRFLTNDEVASLTGRKIRRLQIEALKAMAIPFHINAVGRPVVVAAVVEGRKDKGAKDPGKWQPGCLKKAA